MNRLVNLITWSKPRFTLIAKSERPMKFGDNNNQEKSSKKHLLTRTKMTNKTKEDAMAEVERRNGQYSYQSTNAENVYLKQNCTY